MKKLIFSLLAAGMMLPVMAKVDVSSKLTDAALANESANWALVSNGGNHTASTNGYHESWHNTFTLSQTVTGLEAGYYQLSIQAAVEGGNSTTITLQAVSGSNTSEAVVPKYSTAGSYADMAAWWKADSEATGNANLNRIYTTVKVEEGQSLVATFKQTSNSQWMVYGQMKLYKLTEDEGVNAQTLEAVLNPKTGMDMAGGRFKQRFESYDGAAIPSGERLTQTLTGLPNGKYKVTINGSASYTSGRGFSGAAGNDLTVFFANDKTTPVDVVERTGVGNNEFKDYTVVDAVVTDGTLKFGYRNLAEGANWFTGSIKEIELTELDVTASWNVAVEAATAALSQYDEKYAPTERALVVSLMSTASPTISTITALNKAVADYLVKAANDKLCDEKSDITEGIADIKSNYPNSSNDVLNTDISKWTTSTYVVMNGNEHWSGVKPTKYYEQSAAQWGQNSWSVEASQTVTLPAGHYAFVVTARASQDVTSSMSVDDTQIALSNVGSVGMGIATDGTATYSNEATYAHDGVGFGWEYAFIKFEVPAGGKDVTFRLQSSTSAIYNWVSIANPTLYYQDDAKEAMAVVTARASLKALLQTVSQIPAANIGDGAFYYSSASASAYNGKITAAAAVADAADASLSAIEEQIGILENLTLPALNVPSSTQAYKIVLKYAGWTFDNCAITSAAGARNDAGNYNLSYVAQNPNYAQAFFFTAKEEGYIISWTDADGVTRYVSTGVPYGGNSAQIRTTTDASKAMKVTVSPDNGFLKIRNTEANQLIGSQDAGVYTVNSHTDFVLVETTAQHTVEKSVEEGKYATVVLPFAASGTAYTAAVEDDYITLTEVSALEANKAYILGVGEHSFSGVNVAYKEPGANGILTGVFAATQVPVGSYVLQTVEGEQAFRQVAEGSQPTLAANKAYVTVAANAPILRIQTAETAIETINALVSGEAQIFDLDGRQQSKLQKGINIVNGVKVIVK